MNNLTTFDFQNNKVRIVILNGEPWFVGADVCYILEHSNPSSAYSRLRDYEKQMVDPKQYLNSVSNQDVVVISESGLYRLMLTSRKPQAELFQNWIIQTILPSIKNLNSIDDIFRQTSKIKTNNAGFVYLIKQTKTNLHKIGVSRDVYARLQTLQIGSPFELVILERIFTLNAFLLESQLHEYYQAYSVRGEWFDLSTELAKGFGLVALHLDSKNDKSLTLTLTAK